MKLPDVAGFPEPHKTGFHLAYMGLAKNYPTSKPLVFAGYCRNEQSERIH